MNTHCWEHIADLAASHRWVTHRSLYLQCIAARPWSVKLHSYFSTGHTHFLSLQRLTEPKAARDAAKMDLDSGEDHAAKILACSEDLTTWLPEHMLFLLFLHMPMNFLLNVALVCKRWAAAVRRSWDELRTISHPLQCFRYSDNEVKPGHKYKYCLGLTSAQRRPFVPLVSETIETHPEGGEAICILQPRHN